MSPLVALVLAYLIGSVPVAYLAGRAFGVDLRQVGSGNLGSTNVLRTLGPKVAAPVFALDVAKGALPVLFLPRLTTAPNASLWAIAYGVAAIAGHVRPIFLLRRGGGGGKGVATAAGVFLALAPIPTLIAIAVFATVATASGYVSLGSLAAAAVLPVAVGTQFGPRHPVFALSVLVSSFVVWMHRANIGRLRRGEEHRFRGGRRAA